MKLKLGEQNAILLCNYTSFAEVVSAALGGGSEEGGSKKEDDRVNLGDAPTFEMALANINSALQFG